MPIYEKQIGNRLSDLREVIQLGRTPTDIAFLDDPEAQAHPDYPRTMAALELQRDAPLLSQMSADELDAMIAEEEAKPITLRQVDGLFTFTEAGIDVNELNATIEENRFSISGHYDGYGPDAKAQIKVANFAGREFTLRARFHRRMPARFVQLPMCGSG